MRSPARITTVTDQQTAAERDKHSRQRILEQNRQGQHEVIGNPQRAKKDKHSRQGILEQNRQGQHKITGNPQRPKKDKHSIQGIVEQNRQGQHEIIGNPQREPSCPSTCVLGPLGPFSLFFSHFIAPAFSRFFALFENMRSQSLATSKQKTQKTSRKQATFTFFASNDGAGPHAKKNQNAENIGKASSIHFPLKNNQLGNLHQNTS